MLCPAGNGIHAGRAPTTGHPWPAAALFPLPGCASAARHEELRAAHQPAGQVRLANTNNLTPVTDVGLPEPPHMLT